MPSNSHLSGDGISGGSNTGKPLKALHMGKSIDDLKTQAKVVYCSLWPRDHKTLV